MRIDLHCTDARTEDALTLHAHPAWADDLVARFGALDVREAMLRTGADAVSIVDDTFIRDLILADGDVLLEAAVDDPEAARTVKELTKQKVLKHVSVSTFAAAGIKRRYIKLSNRQLLLMGPSIEDARALKLQTVTLVPSGRRKR